MRKIFAPLGNYFAMAEDGLFFRAVAWLGPHTRVPVIAIILQSVWTMVIALSGRYEQILNYDIRARQGSREGRQTSRCQIPLGRWS